MKIGIHLIDKQISYKESKNDVKEISICMPNETIKNKNLDRDEIEEKLSKIASFQIVDKLNNTLKQIIREYAESFEFVLEDLNKSENIDIIKTENNKIINKID